MKKLRSLIIALLFLFPCSGKAQSACRKETVNGKVTFTPIYKNGARPTPEVLEACCQTRPMSNAKLYIKKNYYSPLQYTITTNASGNFKKRMRPGIYKVFLKNETDGVKAKEIADGKIEQENVWRTEPYYVMEVTSGKDLFFEMDIRDRMTPEDRLRP